MWAREHRELLARRERKERAEEGVRRDKGRDWERLVYPPIPPSCLRVTAQGEPEQAKWREHGLTFHGEPLDAGEVVDVSLLGEWSPQFNALVDLYASHLDDFARWQCASYPNPNPNPHPHPDPNSRPNPSPSPRPNPNFNPNPNPTPHPHSHPNPNPNPHPNPGPGPDPNRGPDPNPGKFLAAFSAAGSLLVLTAGMRP